MPRRSAGGSGRKEHRDAGRSKGAGKGRGGSARSGGSSGAGRRKGPGGRQRSTPNDAGRRKGTTGRAPDGRGRRSGPKGLGGEQVEGRQAVRELILAGTRKVHEVLVVVEPDDRDTNHRDTNHRDTNHRDTDELADLAVSAGLVVREVTRGRLAAEARSEAPQGVIARAAPLTEHLLEDLCVPRRGAPVPFLVVTDGITDPGNLGALLRSAECAGVTGVVLGRHRAVHITPTAAKAAAGAIEHLPMALVGGIPSAISSLRDAGVVVVGLDMAGDPLFDVALPADGPIAVVLGSEGAGLSRLVRQRCDVLASLPLHGALASLNVAAAGAVACYEIARRR